MRRGRRLSLLVDPVEASLLPALDLAVLEPESNLLLGVLDGVGAVADVAADIDGEVATDGAGGRGGGVGGTEEDTAGLDGVTTLPDHGADGAGGHVWGIVSLRCFVFCVVSAGSWRGRPGLFESGRWVRTGDQTGEEGLASEIGVVLLEVLLSGSAELDSSELEAAVLEAGDDGTNEATLGA
jgi:hypothetical protein